jgi:hypothetical protein
VQTLIINRIAGSNDEKNAFGEVVRTAMLAVVLLVVARGIVAAQTDYGEKLKVAYFGFELINTSPQPTSDAENQRLGLVGDTLTQMLADSGCYQFVPLRMC